jgi:hypothetical protein
MDHIHITSLRYEVLDDERLQVSKEHLQKRLDKSLKVSSMKVIDEIYDPNKKVELEPARTVIKIEEIQQIMFGGFSSRFWVMRVHFNYQEDNMIMKMPFKSWNCLTLAMKDRDIDLVICDENVQNLLVKYLLC